MLSKAPRAAVFGIDAYVALILDESISRCRRVRYKELREEAAAEDSAAVRERVVRARKRQLERFASEKRTYANAQMPPKLIRKHCAISAEGEKLLETAVTRLGLSARAHDRILKVARTIADLDSAADIASRHLSEAIQYRTLDRTYWA
jgi:magnesium chelatase family protein